MTIDTTLRNRWAQVALGLAVLLVWGHTVSFEFVWDDKFFIEQSQSIRSLRNVPEMFVSLSAQSSYPEGFLVFRPLRTVHYAILYAVGGGDAPKPWLFHLANVLWHGVSCILLLHVLRAAFERLFGECKRDLAECAAFAGAAAFAVHPAASEVVCWAKGLDDAMATAFLLASSWFLLRCRADSFRSGPYRWSVVFFALAVYAKESAVPFAAFAVVLLAWSLRKVTVRLLTLSIPFFAIAVVYMVHRHFIMGRTSQVEPISGSYAQTLLDTLPAAAIYARLLVGVPPFCADYEYMRPGHALTEPPVLAGAAVILALLGCAALLFRGLRPGRGGPGGWVGMISAAPSGVVALLSAGALWILLFLLPVSNVVPMLQYCADRFLYTSLLGWCAMFAALVVCLWNQRFLRVIVPLVLVAWAVVAWERSWIWKDAVTLFVRTHLEGHSSPRVRDNAVAAIFELPHIRAAFIQVKQPGKEPMLATRSRAEMAHADWKLIESTLEGTRAMFSNDLGVVTGLAIAKIQLGKRGEAIGLFEHAAVTARTNLAFWCNLAQAQADSGDPRKGEAAVRKGLAVSPDSLQCLEKLAELQWQQRNFIAAGETYQQLRKLDPSNSGYAELLTQAQANASREAGSSAVAR